MAMHRESRFYKQPKMKQREYLEMLLNQQNPSYYCSALEDVRPHTASRATYYIPYKNMPLVDKKYNSVHGSYYPRRAEAMFFEDRPYSSVRSLSNFQARYSQANNSPSGVVENKQKESQEDLSRAFGVERKQVENRLLNKDFGSKRTPLNVSTSKPGQYLPNRRLYSAPAINTRTVRKLPEAQNSKPERPRSILKQNTTHQRHMLSPRDIPTFYTNNKNTFSRKHNNKSVKIKAPNDDNLAVSDNSRTLLNEETSSDFQSLLERKFTDLRMDTSTVKRNPLFVGEKSYLASQDMFY